MNKKTLIKTLFTITLSTIFVIMIGFSVSQGNNETSLNDITNSNTDYKIIYKADKCTSEENLIYKENNKEYYTECYKLEDIYINWSDSKIDTLEESLKNKSVTIDSLKKHGLDIKVVDIYEN